jgi:hypothetical protein
MFGYDYDKVLIGLGVTKETNNEFKDISLVIAAAITAYARIHMAEIKLDLLGNKGNLYYTDTDSIVTDIALDSKLIGNKLGQFKLEYEIDKAYFISSKTYCLVLKEGSFDGNNELIFKDTSTGITK